VSPEGRRIGFSDRRDELPMPRILTPDARLLRSLPLPMAQLYDDGCYAKNPRDRHDYAYYLWELGLKLLAMVAVTETRASAETTAPVAEVLQRLARPSVGHWWEIVQTLYPALALRDPERFDAVGGLLSGRDRLDGERLRQLRSRLHEQLKRRDGKDSVEISVNDLFSLLLTYRNRFIGHNIAVRRPTELLHEIGDELLLGLAELYRHLDPLVGGRLVYVESVTAAGGMLEVRAQLLRGTEPVPLPPQTLPRAGAGHLDGRRVYLAYGPDRIQATSLRSLHPLLYYKPEERTFWCLNSRPSDRRAELICCTNGDYQVLAVDPPAASSLADDLPPGYGIVGREDEIRRLADDHRQWLVETFNQPIDPAELDRWAEATVDDATTQEETLNEGDGPVIRVGDFEVLSTIAKTAVSSVHRARQLSLNREVALKLQRNIGAIEEERRFVREVRAMGLLAHPSLARIYNSGLHDQRIYYVMELVDGPTLQHVWDEMRSAGDACPWMVAWEEAQRKIRAAEEWVGRRPPADEEANRLQGPPSPPEDRPYYQAVAGWIGQVASAANCLHRANIVHRDIKPSNIILTADAERAVLADLGSARDITAQTVGAGFVGTIRYAAPEQIADAQSADPRSDIYSLGMVLWECLTLAPAFDADGPEALSRLITTKDLPVPSTVRPGIPIELEAVALKCLARDPERRYQSADALAEDLGRFLRGEDVQAPLPTTWYRVKRWARHRRAILAVAAVALLLSVGASAATWVLTRPGEDPMVRLRRGEIARKAEARSRAGPKLDRVSPHPVAVADRPPETNLSDFQILEDYREVDLRDWRRVPPGAPTHTTGYTSNRQLKLVKLRDAGMLWVEARTSGADLIPRCITPNPQTAQVVALTRPVDVGRQQMLSRFLGLDVQDLGLNEEFDVQYVVTYWNALQHPDEQWFGVVGYEKSYKVSMLILFPEDRPYLDVRLEVAKRGETPRPFAGRKILIEAPDRHWLYWEIAEPVPDHVYQIHWSWPDE
jgi:eukaryotic-like serine/threonine-protein kinase